MTRVLICEDDSLTALRLQTLLSALGYEVSGRARDGEEAVSLTRRLRPDVVLMDIAMPGMDGIQATERIMRDHPTAVVMLTSYGDAETVRRATEAGAAAYLVKPLRDEQLSPTIAVALARFTEGRLAFVEWERSFALGQERTFALEQERDQFLEVVREAEEEAMAVRRWADDLRSQFEHEREAARTLAESFFCPAPEFPGVEVATCYETASEVMQVGGDFVDFIELTPHRLGLVLGDVCGKGVAAASYTAMARYMLRAFASEDPSPGRLLGRLNRALHRQMSNDSPFLTLVYGVLDVRTFQLVYGNAGHVPPLLHLPGTEGWRELLPTGGLLAVEYGWEWEEKEVFLEPGSVLALFTDGVTEARGAAGFLESRGVGAAIESCLTENATLIAASILQRAREFSEARLQDDATIVVIRRPDAAASSELAG